MSTHHPYGNQTFLDEPAFAQMALCQVNTDLNIPHGFEGPTMAVPPTLEHLYGKAMNAKQYKKPNETPGHKWILDGGATHHMSPLRISLFDYVEDTVPMFVKVANKKWERRAGVGSIKVHTKVNGIAMIHVITDVWHMPNFDNSLLSVNQLKEHDHWIISGRKGDMGEYIFDTNNELWCVCKLHQGLNVPMWAVEMHPTKKTSTLSDAPPNTTMPVQSIPTKETFDKIRDMTVNMQPMSRMNTYTQMKNNLVHPTKTNSRPIPMASFARSNTSTDKETAELWHRRLGHVNTNSLQTLVSRKSVTGINIPAHELGKCATNPCEICIMAKFKRAPHLKELAKPTEPLHTGSSDIAGPYRISTLDKMVFIVTFVDWCTRYVDVALLRKKSHADRELRRIILKHENQTGRKLKRFFTDRGGEYISQEFKEWMDSKGIIHEFSVAHTPQQNGIAERMNQTLNNMVRAMLLTYNTYPALWGEAMMYAARILNCSFNKDLGITPTEALTGKVPDVSTFRTFGCLVYVRVAECDRAKLDPKSIPGIFLGPEHQGPGYRVLVYKPEYKGPNKYLVQVFRDIVSFENVQRVTGPNSVASMHWGGYIPLPEPVVSNEYAAIQKERDGEAQTSHHGARLLEVGLPNVNERLDLSLEIFKEHSVEQPPSKVARAAHNIPFNEGGRTLALEKVGDPRGEDRNPSTHIMNTRSSQRPSVYAQPASTVKVGERRVPEKQGPPPSRGENTLDLGVQHLVGLNPSSVPAYVQRSGEIKRVGVANLCLASGNKRKRVEFNDQVTWIENPSEFRKFIQNLEYDPVQPAAYNAQAPYSAPSPDLIPSKESLVDGLLRAFKVPEYKCGPLPILTQVDPKNPPNTIKQAMESKYAKFWAMAIIDEWLSIVGNNTWELVDKAPWMKVIPCKWVFLVKVDEKGIPMRFKARLVAGGHRQVEGVDYDETYAPVSRMATLRILLGVSASRKWKVHQIDIKTAFLHGKADMDIFMKQPPGFEDGSNLVCKLRKTLYGLKQAPRAWYFVLKGVLTNLGFEQVSADSSFWIHKANDVVVFLTTIVDDMLVVSPNEAYTLHIIDEILKKLPGTHGGRAKHYNGLRITWLDNTKEVVITQAAHVEKLYEKFSRFMSPSVQRSLPGPAGLRVCKSGSNLRKDSHDLDVQTHKYRELIGGISYITHCTRPDAIHVNNQLAKMANEPKWEHWCLAIDLLSYLHNTRYWGLRFGGNDVSMQVDFLSSGIKMQHMDPMVVGYADANHGTGIDDKKSITGYVIKVHGGPVAWASRTQPLTAASTTESEFRALSECTREALWIAKLLKAFGIKSEPFLIRGDSQGALHAITNHTYTKHTKHIEIVHDFMKDRLQTGQLKFEYVKGTENPADIFTKCLPFPAFEKLRVGLGMVELAAHMR